MFRFLNELIYICVITIFIAMQYDFCYSLAFFGFASFNAILKYESLKETVTTKRI